MSVQEDGCFQAKILLLGSAMVGKSSILCRFSDDTFPQSYVSTIGVDFKHCFFDHKKKPVKFQVWDTAGQERFRTIASSYFRGAHACFLIFDLTSPQSFADLERFIVDINTYCKDKPKVIVVGTKCDAVPSHSGLTVSSDEINNFCKSKSFPYIEVSAKTGHNIKVLFGLTVDLLISSVYSDLPIAVPAPLKIAVESYEGLIQEWIDKLVFKLKDTIASSTTATTTSSSSSSTIATDFSTTAVSSEITITDELMGGRVLDEKDFDLSIHSHQIDLPSAFVPKLINKATTAIKEGFRHYAGKGVPKSFEALKFAKEDFPTVGLTCCVHDPEDPSICELFTNNEVGLLSKNYIIFECLLKPSYLESTYFWSKSSSCLHVGPAGLTTVLWDVVNSYLAASQTDDLYVRFYSYEVDVGKSVQYAACELKGLKTLLTASKTCVRFTRAHSGEDKDQFTVIVSHSAFLVSKGGKSVEVRFSQYPTVCVVSLPSLRLVMCVEQGKLLTDALASYEWGGRL